MSCDHISEIARRYEADKNEAQARLNWLSRKFADITNDEDDHSHQENALCLQDVLGLPKMC